MPVAAGFLVAEFIVTAAAGLVVAVFRVLLLFAVFRVAMTVALLLFAVFRVPVAVTYSTSHRLVQIGVNTSFPNIRHVSKAVALSAVCLFSQLMIDLTR